MILGIIRFLVIYHFFIGNGGFGLGVGKGGLGGNGGAGGLGFGGFQ